MLKQEAPLQRREPPTGNPRTSVRGARQESSPFARLDDRAALLVSLLCDRHGLTISEDIARQDISDDLDHVARLMRIGRQAAKFYVTDDSISAMADRSAAAVAERQGAPAEVAAAGQRAAGLPDAGVDVVDLDTERRRRR